MNVFLIESPLQLLNAIEAKKYFRLKDSECSLIVLRAENINTVNQVNNMLVQSAWHNIIFVGKGKGKITWLTRLAGIRSLIVKFRNLEKVFIGDYRSDVMRAFVNNVTANDIFLLDDGTVTLRIYESLSDPEKRGRLVNSSRKDVLKKVIHSVILFGKAKGENLENLKLFTVFNLDTTASLKVIKHNYAYLRGLMKKSDQVNKVFFLGSPLTEKNVMSDEVKYLKYLKEAKEYYSDFDMVYIPHRAESAEKLKRIKSEIGVDIREIDTCIEHELISKAQSPKIIASFYSSALNNCYYIFGETVEVNSFEIKDEDLNPRNLGEIKKIYHYFGEKFKVMQLF